MGHEVAQVCLSGHTVNENADGNPEFSKDFCTKCGAATITACPGCGSSIPGWWHLGGYITVDGNYVSAFCHRCGKPYPWTEAKLEAAKEFADMMEGLSDEEREKLKQSLPDLIADTPRTALAATRWKTYLAKTAQVVADGFKEVMYSVAVEAAKKGIWG